MASVKKLRKTDKKSHPGRGGNFLKAKGKGMKRLSFYTPSDRRANKKAVNV